jgi:hypothetical protein
MALSAKFVIRLRREATEEESGRKGGGLAKYLMQ